MYKILLVFFGVWENLVFCFRDLLTFSLNWIRKVEEKDLRAYCTNIYTVPGLVKAEISINQEGNSVLRIKLEYIYKYMRFFMKWLGVCF